MKDKLILLDRQFLLSVIIKGNKKDMKKIAQFMCIPLEDNLINYKQSVNRVYLLLSGCYIELYKEDFRGNQHIQQKLKLIEKRIQHLCVIQDQYILKNKNYKI